MYVHAPPLSLAVSHDKDRQSTKRGGKGKETQRGRPTMPSSWDLYFCCSFFRSRSIQVPIKRVPRVVVGLKWLERSRQRGVGRAERTAVSSAGASPSLFLLSQNSQEALPLFLFFLSCLSVSLSPVFFLFSAESCLLLCSLSLAFSNCFRLSRFIASRQPSSETQPNSLRIFFILVGGKFFPSRLSLEIRQTD